MAGEIALEPGTTGLTLKALILGGDRSKRWDGSAFVAISSVADADWVTGMVSVAEEQTSDATATAIYTADFPTAITASAEYMILFYSGASPTPGQAALGQQAMWWDGFAQVAPSDNIYTAEGKYTRDQGNTQDRYTVQWLKNGIIVADTAISDAKITVDKDDGTRIINNQDMTERATPDIVVYTASAAERLTVGEGGRALFQATIDGATRSWPLTISRDSS